MIMIIFFVLLKLWLHLHTIPPSPNLEFTVVLSNCVVNRIV